MRLRALLLTTAALCAAAPAADAAPKRPAPMCVAYTNAPGATPAPGMSAYDIRRMTVAVGRDQMAATLEVAGALDRDDLDLQRVIGGAGWTLTMNLDAVDYSFQYEVDGVLAGGETTSEVTAGSHRVKHAVVVRGDSVTWLLPLRELRVGGKPNDRVHLAAATYSWGGTADTLSGVVRKSARTCTIPR